MEYIVASAGDITPPTEATNTAQAHYSFIATAASITIYATANLATADSDSFHFQIAGLSPWATKNGMQTAGFQEITLATINGAVIGKTYVLKIQRREAGAKFDKFRLDGGLFVNATNAVVPVLLPPDLVVGKNTFDSLCAGCHGPLGKGANAPAITDTRTLEALTSFINVNMPKNNPALCVGQCARDVAGYIKNGFSVVQTNEKFTLAELNGDVKVEYIENCGVNSPVIPGKTFSFFNQTTNRIQGWSHVPAFPIEFATVKNGPLADPRYFIAEEKKLEPPSTASVINDSSCNDQKTYGVILVRKYNTSGNMHGHSNGIEPRFPSENLTFSQLDSIVLEMKLDRKSSNILTQAELQTQLGISAAQASNVDHGEITLKVYGYSPTGYGGQTSGTILRLNLDKYADKWIRVTIKTNGVGGATKLSQMVMYTMLWGDSFEAHAEGSPLAFKEIALNLKNYYMVLN